MTATQTSERRIETPQARITDEVGSWPGVTVERSQDRTDFTVDGHSIGHLHGSRAAHFHFPEPVWRQLRRDLEIELHPSHPETVGPAARRLNDEVDVIEVVELFRLNYELAIPDRG